MTIMKDLLENLGCDIFFKKSEKEMLLKLNIENQFKAEYKIVRKMRASILVLGPLLARYGQAVVDGANQLAHRRMWYWQ